jgi:integrase
MKICNTLQTYRRHLTTCTIKNKPVLDSSNKKLKAACRCPIVASGYLEFETDAAGRRKRIRHLSLGTSDWTEAAIIQGELLKRKRVTEIAPKPTPSVTEAPEPARVTVAQAVKRYIESRGEHSTDPIEPPTLEKYKLLFEQRLLPYCRERNVTYITHFENKDNCRQFVESWRQVKRKIGSKLGDETKRIHLYRFRTLLRYCVDAEWMKVNGAIGIKSKVTKEHRRYGLELAEYSRVLIMAHDPEVKAAIELMRWCGLRISDAMKFHSSELVRNVSNNGWNADFVQRKTKKRCIVPVPDHVVEQLKALPLNPAGNYFRCSQGVMADRITTVFQKANAVVRFKNHVTPHCLRHTFAIQNLNAGVDIALVSKWMGHESVAITQKHYRNDIESTKLLAEQVSRDAVAKMLAASAAA